MNILKRNGAYEKFNSQKLLNALNWACEGYNNVEPLEIISAAQMRFVDGMRSSKVQETLIKAAESLISIKSADYQYVAARLLSMHTRKQLFGVFLNEEMPTIESIIESNVKRGFYDPLLLTKFTSEEYAMLDLVIDHSLDNKMEYAGYRKMIDTYVMKDRSNGYVFETPQYAFMIMSLAFANSIEEAIENYTEMAINKATSYATPIMAGVRTTTKQFASCVLVDIGDDVNSMGASLHAVIRYISKKAGLGLNFGRWRGKNSKIRNGEVMHTGVIPILRIFMNATKGFSQGGIRQGSSTAFYPVWTYEFAELAVLKNSKGNEDNRLKSLDYCVQLTAFFYKRMLANQTISFFSTSEVPGLYESFGLPEFDALYEKYESDKSIRRKEMSGLEVMEIIAGERQGHGKLYVMNMDNVENYNRFLDKIYMSNLCFTGDTKVLVTKADGSNDAIRIDKLAQEVTSFDHGYTVDSAKNINGSWETHNQNKQFVAFKTSDSAEIIEITLANGFVFKCTPEHKLALADGTYVEAELSFGKQIKSYFNDSVVTGITNISENEAVYCLHVKDNHNFFIGDDWDNAILVHNCVEIVEPTTPILNVDDKDGEIALCNLGAYNLGVIDGPDTFHKMRKGLHILVRNVDRVITMQDTVVAAADKQNKRRSIGIGISNFAYWMAKNGFRYDDPKALVAIDELMEHFQYYLIEGSMLQAKEIGACEFFGKTIWSKGFMPIDNQNARAYALTGNRERKLDWEWLRGEVAKYGMRNSVLSAFMPVESSSVIWNATNASEPPRNLMTKKGNETSGFIPIIVPEALKLASMYTTAWELPNLNSAINKIAGVMQMWVDQAISVNHYYQPLFFPDGQVERKKVIKDIIEFHTYGGKNLYYANTDDSSLHQEEPCESCVV